VTSGTVEAAGGGSGGWYARTFRALHTRNYRLFMTGQSVSVVGTWVQRIAQDWLVLELTHSGTVLGFMQAFQYLPILLCGPWGGVLADRFDKRKLLLCTQALSAVMATLLGVVTVAGVVKLWMVFVLAAGLGMATAVDNPGRQTFVIEMVGKDDVANAVTLNSVAVNLARIVGPAIAALLIATIGTGPCFLVNGASFLGAMAALWRLDVTALQPAPRQERRRRQLREGLAYVRRTPALLGPLVLLGVVGTFGYEMQVILPLMARNAFHGGASSYGALTSAMGAGAVVGGLVVAGRARASTRGLTMAAMAFGSLLIVLALVPNLSTGLVVLPFLGMASITFLSCGNATLQLHAAPEMRGRVMALWGVAFLGTTPVGGPLIGFIGQHFGARWGALTGGAVSAAAGLVAWAVLIRPARAGRGAVEGPVATPLAEPGPVAIRPSQAEA
jgi:MFS family permease